MNPEKYHWFAEDGSYGSGVTLVVDTSNWTDEDWRDIEDTSDSERSTVALEITKKRRG
jgi:hypothetical protein